VIAVVSQRAILGNAKIAGFQKDLHLGGYDYNRILSVFYISYILFEIPSNIVCKIVGPGWFIPSISLGFGICSICTAFVHNIHSASAVRFLLGMFEAGMMPGIAYYLSRWYRRSELAFRLSLYIVMAPLAGAFGGLLASGILKLHHFGGLHTWRMVSLFSNYSTIFYDSEELGSCLKSPYDLFALVSLWLRHLQSSLFLRIFLNLQR
jgi:MFS family permease